MSNIESGLKIPVKDMLDTVSRTVNSTQELLTRAIVTYIHISYQNISQVSFDIINQAIVNTGDSLGAWYFFQDFIYMYYYASTIVNALSGWTWTYSNNVFKQAIVSQINEIWAPMADGFIRYLEWDVSYANKYTLPRVKQIYDKATSFRNSIILYVDDLYDIAEKHRTDIDNLLSMLNSLNTTFTERVESVIDPYFESWYAYWDYWYTSQWETLVDQLYAFQTEYETFNVQVTEIIEQVENQSVDLDDIRKKLYTPFSNVYELKDKDKESFEYQLHLLQTLIIEAFGLEFPSVREKMIENIDVILGKKQQKPIEGGDDYVRRIEPRR